MTRNQLLDFLTRSVRDELISESRAIEFLRQFDAGTLTLDEFPLGADAGEQDEEDAALALIPWLISLGLLSASIRRVNRETQLRLIDLALRDASDGARIVMRDLLRERFKAEAASLAGRALAGWQRRMTDLIRLNALEQWMLGAGHLPTAEDLALIEADIERQLAFLSRFADQNAIAKANGKPLSEQYIAMRSGLYGGTGYAEFFKGAHSELLLTEPDLSNWVYYYVSVDDDGTCLPCLAAEAAGPYAGDDPAMPYPGQVCLGGSRCRCTLEAVYDPAAAIEIAA